MFIIFFKIAIKTVTSSKIIENAMIAVRISNDEKNLCFKYSGENSNKLKDTGYSSVLRYGKETIKNKQTTKILTSFSKPFTNFVNVRLFFAFSLVFLDDPDKTLTTIEVQAKTPPKHAPSTAGNDLSNT